MKDDLLHKSSQWAQKAIQNYLDNDFEQFFIHAGVAFELLGKAFLASIHPSLIVDRDFDSLLQVCGAGNHSKRAPGNIRTIGARDVISRVNQILPQLKSYEQQLTTLADLRNGVVHLGSIYSTQPVDMLSPFLHATEIVLKAFKSELDIHFGTYAGMVQTLLDKSTREVERTVAIKITRAQELYKSKFGDVDEQTLKQIFDVIFKSYIFHAYEDEQEPCPACGHFGVASGEYEVEWENVVWDEPDLSPEVTLYVNHFNCKMCGLILEGIEEIKVSPITEKIQVEHVYPDDFF